MGAGSLRGGATLTSRQQQVVEFVVAGLSNREIAKALAISERTAEGHLDQVRNKLGLNTRAQIAAWAVEQSLVAAPSAPRRSKRSNLPVELTTFIDRERELGELRGLLSRARLLTLTGPGGCGKTRLALRLAADAAPGYDALMMVDLGDVREASQLEQTVAAALGRAEQPGRPLHATLSDSLRAIPTLLLLDTCEHIVAAVAAFASLQLRMCPLLRIVATSREPLRVSGETTYRVDPFELPPFGANTAVAAASSPAVQLFVDRATARQPGFELTDAQAVAAALICRRVDGLPLGVELAAGEIGLLSIDEIAEQMLDPFETLASDLRDQPERQRSLHATISWSLKMLDEPERAVLRRLAVFPAEFDLRTAEAICASDDVPSADVARHLARLVARSLVIAQNGLYRQLDTVREFGARLLDAAGEADERLHRLALHCRERFEAPSVVTAAYRSDRPPRVLPRLAETALDWCAINDPHLGLSIAVACAPLWLECGYPSVARRRLESLLGSKSRGRWKVRERARLSIGRFAYLQGDLAAATSSARRAADYARSIGDDTMLAEARMLSGMAALAEGDVDTAHVAFEDELAASRRAGDRLGEALALHQIGSLAALAGRREQARRWLLDSLAIRSELGDHAGGLVTVTFLAGIAFLDRETATAVDRVNQALEIGRTHRDNRVAYTLDVAAAMAAAHGDCPAAVRLAGAASSLRQSAGWWAPTAWNALVSLALDPARAELGPDACKSYEADGAALEFDAAIELAIGSVGR